MARLCKHHTFLLHFKSKLIIHSCSTFVWCKLKKSKDIYYARLRLHLSNKIKKYQISLPNETKLKFFYHFLGQTQQNIKSKDYNHKQTTILQVKRSYFRCCARVRFHGWQKSIKWFSNICKICIINHYIHHQCKQDTCV